MTMPCYKSGKLMITAACYKSSKSMMTSLIIRKIRFVYFQENDINGSLIRLHAKSNARSHAKWHARSCIRSYDHKSRDYNVIYLLNIMFKSSTYYQKWTY